MHSITEVEAEIHLTDLAFVQLCEEKYEINRGVYNAIDTWFYVKGIKHILNRRATVIEFLEHLKVHFIQKNCSGKLKFGHGGLTNQLEDFWMSKHN